MNVNNVLNQVNREHGYIGQSNVDRKYEEIYHGLLDHRNLKEFTRAYLRLAVIEVESYYNNEAKEIRNKIYQDIKSKRLDNPSRSVKFLLEDFEMETKLGSS